MDYDYNRRAFRSVTKASAIEPLAALYCACVLIELSLKQHLSLCTSVVNSGHDLPALIQRVGLIQPKHAVTCNALKAQVADALAKLYSQNKAGVAAKVPANSYPHIRYLRHASDWQPPNSSDADLTALSALIERVASALSRKMGVTL